MIPFLSLHPTLLSLTRTHLSPIPSIIHHLLNLGPPYPNILAKLPQLSLLLPDDMGTMFIEILVRARPKWILERLEIGRWKDDMWREAFERRFLPSWRRFKGEGDTWRAIFIRTLGRIEHRSLGCTHEESWTRFITLHRNGSASINRIYSRLFDPYDIYDELKHQNNFASQPTQVRIILHLQDVRIIALGVLLPQPSLFVNPNAHLLLHPPLLRGLISEDALEVPIPPPKSRPPPVVRLPTASASPGANSNEAYFPLVRSSSPTSPATTSYGLGDPASGSAGPSSGTSLRSTFSKAFPGRSRRTSSLSESTEEASARFGGRLALVRSRDSDDGNGRRRTWSFGRARQGSGTTPTTEIPPELRQSIDPITPTMPTLPELPSPPALTCLATQSPPTPPATPTPPRRGRHHKPYSTLVKPLPLSTHACFPNYTPSDTPISTPARDLDPTAEADKTVPTKMDRRHLHFEVEDDSDGQLWSAGEAVWSGDETKMAEWDSVEGIRKRWVGPMILIAQLHLSDRVSAQPHGADSYGPVEGTNVDLGPKGMYVSLGFEDLETLMGWVELRGGGAHVMDPRRSGLGFE